MACNPKKYALMILLGIGIWIMLAMIIGTLFLGGCGPPDVGTDAPSRNKTLLWDARPAAEHIDFYTVFMDAGPISFRIGTTREPSFILPKGPYTRTFRVSATPDSSWPFPESPKSQPITTHL